MVSSGPFEGATGASGNNARSSGHAFDHAYRLQYASCYTLTYIIPQNRHILHGYRKALHDLTQSQFWIFIGLTVWLVINIGCGPPGPSGAGKSKRWYDTTCSNAQPRSCSSASSQRLFMRSMIRTLESGCAGQTEAPRARGNLWANLLRLARQTKART